MAHWRDGGIGNMAGSDDRPLVEYTLLEQLAAMGVGLNAAQLRGLFTQWGGLPTVAQAAFTEIVRLRAEIERRPRPAFPADREAKSLLEAHYKDALGELAKATAEITDLRERLHVALEQLGKVSADLGAANQEIANLNAQIEDIRNSEDYA